MKKTFLLILLAAGTLVPSFAQQFIDLSGRWEFQIDRKDVGVEQRWFSQTLDDSIQLPGSMPEMLKGDLVSTQTQWTGSLYDSSYYYNPAMEKYRQEGNIKLPFFLTPDRHYVGVAWYGKEVNIPADWKNSRVVLFLERPHIETTVWVNGQKVGMRNSLCVAHQYDVTKYLKKGRNSLAVRVDNRIKEINVGPDSHSITDQTQGNWNGMVGKLQLQATSPLYFDDIQVFPNVQQQEARVRMVIGGTTAKIRKGTLQLSAQSFNSAQKHQVPLQSYPVTLQKGQNTLEVTFRLGNGMLTWDEFDPALYRLTAQLTAGKESSTRTVQFGMREFTIEGRWFYVNGRKTMLRGTVENCDFPLTGYAPMEVKDWERVFRICKNYGLNHMRFHSFCPPEAAFMAADVVGFYLQPEGPSWPNHGSSLGDGKPIDKYLLEETQRMAKYYGNYASFCMLACGNEPRGRWVAWASDFVDYWKATDSRRVYTGASVGGSWQWQPKSQYHVKAGARGLTWDKGMPESRSDFRKQGRLDVVTEPFVSHETGQWCVFPNFNEIRKYTGVNKARNFEIFRDLLEENHMGNRGQDFMMASGKLQALCYKNEIEKTMRTPDYAGFQLLALNDYSGQGTALVGVLDVFFEEKGYIDARAFRRFCCQTVPLIRMDKFVYTNTETLRADVEIAHFGKSPLLNATAVYTLKDEQGKIYEQKALTTTSIPIGSNFNLGTISCDLKDFTEPQKLILEVAIAGTEFANDWEIWVYPKEVSCPEGKVLVTSTLDEKALQTLEKGGNVLLTAAGKISYGKEIVQQFQPVFWNTSWFKMRPPHTTGIFVNNCHPLFLGFPTEYHSNLQWWELLNRAQVMQFTDFPADFQPLVQSIDTWFLSRKIGMLFEAKVGNGKLMMTSMDIDSRLDERVVARQMRKAILDYMNSPKFRPEFSVSIEQINDLYTKVAPKVNSYTKASPDELKPKIN